MLIETRKYAMSRRHRDALAHVAGEGQAADQEQRPEGVDQVVHVEAVAWAAPLPEAGQRPVQAVAQPVEDESQVHHVEPQRVLRAPGVGEAGQQHRQQTQRGQVVRSDPRRRAGREPQQDLLLDRGGQPPQLPPGLVEASVLFHLSSCRARSRRASGLLTDNGRRPRSGSSSAHKRFPRDFQGRVRTVPPGRGQARAVARRADRAPCRPRPSTSSWPSSSRRATSSPRTSC